MNRWIKFQKLISLHLELDYILELTIQAASLNSKTCSLTWKNVFLVFLESVTSFGQIQTFCCVGGHQKSQAHVNFLTLFLPSWLQHSLLRSIPGKLGHDPVWGNQLRVAQENTVTQPNLERKLVFKLSFDFFRFFFPGYLQKIVTLKTTILVSFLIGHAKCLFLWFGLLSSLRNTLISAGFSKTDHLFICNLQCF